MAPNIYCEFHENRGIEICTLLTDMNEFLFMLSTFLCVICVKLGITDLHIMLLSIWEYHENDCREGRTYLISEITFTCVL
jgi:hypothetical protein